MFKVFDRKKKQLDLLENPISPVITNELGGIGELTFSVPSTYKHLELEGYIQVENDHEYVIKEIVTHGTNRDIVCMLNIEEILGMAWSKFISRDNTLMKCAELVLSGTGWRAVDKSSCNVKRNLYGTVTNSYNLLQMMCTVYNVEFIFDTYNKVVTFVDKVGKDAGVYFINDINLKQLNVDTHTHKYITRVIPVGKDGLTIESVNNGKNYLENKTYTTKNIYGIWQSDKHDNPQALMDDARRFLDEMAIPYETYEVVVDDLYALKGYEEFEYGLGDIVTIIDGDTETRIQQRIIQRTYNLLEPDKDTIHIANKDATFEDYYKRLQTIADMTQSVIGSDGTINGGNISDGTISGDKIENDSINSDHISSGSITSTHIKAEQILADHIMSNQITTNHLVAESITSDHIQANSIDTKHLKANIIQAEHIQSNTINSNHISANTITSGHIQSGAITAGSGIIADGAIGNAQISKIDAGKIEAGTIDTSKVTIQGADGHLRLKGNRMQVFQGTGNQAKERVSVGDVNGDGTVYGLRVRGADGQTVLLDENGVTSEGITDGSITNDKINEDANIDGAKLNINSVINKINTDGTEIIQGTKVEVDGTNLGVKLSEITNKQTEDSERITQAYSQIEANEKAIKLKVDEQIYTSDKKDMTSKLEKNTSEISAMKGQIALKVEQTDIDNAKNELTGIMDSKISSAKSEIKITTDDISQTVSDLSQTVSTKADGSVVNSINKKVSSLESNVGSITSRVSNVENRQTEVDGKVSSLESRMSTAESKITEDAITNVVSKGFYSKNDIDSKGYQTESEVQQTVNGLEVKVSQSGGYNLLRNTSFLNGSTYWSVGDGRVVDTSRKNGVNNSMKIVSTGATSAVWKGTTQRFAENIPTGKTYRATLYYYVADKSTFNSSFTLELKGRKTGTTSESGIASTSVSPSDLVVGQWTKITVKCTTTQSWDYLYIYPWIHMNGTIWVSNPIVTEGELEVAWSPHPNEVYDGITTVDKDGITVNQSNAKSKTTMSANGFAITRTDNGNDIFRVGSNGLLTLNGVFKCYKDDANQTGARLESSGAIMLGYNDIGKNNPVFASGLWTKENMGYFSVGYTRADISDENGCLWISPTEGNTGCRLTYSKLVDSEVKTTNIFFQKDGTLDFTTSMVGTNDVDDAYIYKFDGGVHTKSLKCNSLRTHNIYPRNNSNHNIGTPSLRYSTAYLNNVCTTNENLVLGTVTSSSAWQTYGGLAINSTTGYVFPHKGNGNLSLGTSGNRFHTLYSVNAVNVSSDRRLKTDIHYLDEPIKEIQVINGDTPRVDRNMNITTQDMYDFIKNDLKLASYRYKANIERGDTSVDYNFIAQDILYTKVGSEIVKLEDNADLDSMLSYNQGNYISVVVGALQKEIELRDKQIANLEKRLAKLESKLK